MDRHATQVQHWREVSRRRRAAVGGGSADASPADANRADPDPVGSRRAGSGAASLARDPASDAAPRRDTPADDAATDDAAAEPAVSATPRPRWKWWIELPVLLLVAFLVTFLIQTFVARVYYVPSGSMEPTLHGVESGGDRILAYKLGYTFGEPEQGDVVVFKGPPSWAPEANIPGPSTWVGKLGRALGSVVGIAPPDEKDFVKRIVALGGQTVSCCDEEGQVQVDGVSLDEPYVLIDPGNAAWRWVPGESNCDIDPGQPAFYPSIRCFGPYTVPEGSVWVMGDHRSDSADSAYQCRGLVPGPNVQCQGPVPVEDLIGRAVAIVMPPSRWGGIGSPDPMAAGG